MALIKCPECRTEVSSLAASCPKCAAPISQLAGTEAAGQQATMTKRTRKLVKEHTAFSIVLAVFGFIIARSSDGSRDMKTVGVMMILAGIVWFLATMIVRSRRLHALPKNEFPVDRGASGERMKAEDPQQAAALQKKLALENRFRNGINWFYWIAGLSIVNTVSYLSGLKISFVIGLGATQFVDGFTGAAVVQFARLATLIRAIGVVIDLVIAGVFVLFGYLGRKRNRGVIIAGVVLYAADAILLVVFKDYLGAAFHAWALLGIWGGLKALDQLRSADKPPASDVIGTLR